MKNIRWLTALTGLGLCVAAVFSFLSCVVSFSLSGLILCVYLFPIGLIIAITETEKFAYERVVKAFPMLKSHTGRGLTYVFVAGLTLSVGTLACYIVGGVLLAEGVMSIAYHHAKDKTTPAATSSNQDFAMNSLEAGNRSTQQPAQPTAAEPGSRSLKQDPGSDFGRQDAGSGFGSAVSAAAFDYASNNPQQAAKAAQAAYGFAKENPELARKAHGAML